jgi:hypothetical protein
MALRRVIAEIVADNSDNVSGAYSAPGTNELLLFSKPCDCLLSVVDAKDVI